MKKFFLQLKLRLAVAAFQFRARLECVRPPWLPPKYPCGAQFANIGEGTRETGVMTLVPDVGQTLSSRYLMWTQVGASNADHCVVCGAGVIPLGPSDDAIDPNDLSMPIAIKILGAVRGTVRVVTDGTAVNGSKLTTAANGQVTATTTTNLVVGVALIRPDDLDFATAGAVIEMIPVLPMKSPF